VIGKIAVTGQQTILRDLDKESGELSGLDWLPREQIRGFAGMAITFKGEILGVVASFARMNMPEEARAWRQIFADHICSAVANARAFEEMRRLKAQLEMQNTYLEEVVVEARAFGELVGQSAPFRQIVSQIDLVAPTDALRSSFLVKLARAKNWWPVKSTIAARAKRNRSSASIAPPFQKNCLRANSSVTLAARLQERLKTAPDVSRLPKVERSSSTKSRTFLWNCKANCCEFCRTSVTSGSAKTARARQMSALWARLEHFLFR